MPLPQGGIYLVSCNVPLSCKAPLSIYLNKCQLKVSKPTINHQKLFQQFDKMKGNRPYPKRPSLGKVDQKCWHSSLNRGSHRKVSWFKVEDADFVAIFKVITDTRFSNDIRHCSKFLHTGHWCCRSRCTQAN